MSNLDVTPLGASPGGGGGRVYHRRGWVRIILGAVLCVLAAGALAYGIVQFIGEQNALLDDAVVTGQFTGGPVAFEAEAGDYTILMLTPGSFKNEAVLERDVTRSACAVRLADGTTATVNGNRQSYSTTTDNARSIGVFEAVAGPATVQCARRRGLEAFSREYVVTPGKAAFGTLIVPMGIAALLGILGGLLIAWGVRGKKLETWG